MTPPQLSISSQKNTNFDHRSPDKTQNHRNKKEWEKPKSKNLWKIFLRDVLNDNFQGVGPSPGKRVLQGGRGSIFGVFSLLFHVTRDQPGKGDALLLSDLYAIGLQMCIRNGIFGGRMAFDIAYYCIRYQYQHQIIFGSLIAWSMAHKKPYFRLISHKITHFHCL